MIKELNTATIIDDHSNEGLVKSGMGSVIMIHDGGKVFEVEFVTLTGDTLGVLTLTTDEIGPISAHDVPHVRVV